MPIKLKRKFHKTVVKSAMLCGTEMVSVRKTGEKKRDVAEVRMLRWMSGVTREDRIRTDYIRGSTEVVKISRKVHKGRGENS